MSKIDTRIRHVTKPGANLFAELGRTEAREYDAYLREKVEAARECCAACSCGECRVKKSALDG
ncbi:hypothetical protein [Trinickia terrae]|uniref:hypothetical protein n=1 Tax=Trinickia terrae TaxID=2571161 RepID=UPI001981323A|nr:hypothetical protein [Trinickia terrae]